MLAVKPYHNPKITQMKQREASTTKKAHRKTRKAKTMKTYRPLKAFAIGAVIAVAIWYLGWFIYTESEIWAFMINTSYQNLLLFTCGLIIAATLAVGFKEPEAKAHNELKKSKTSTARKAKTEKKVKRKATTIENLNKISAFLGLLGAVNLLFLTMYIFTIYIALASIPPMPELSLQIYSTTILAAISTIALVYGSLLIWHGEGFKGAKINLVAGILVPVPMYIYFTYFTETLHGINFLSWLNVGSVPVGFTLLVPAIASGIIAAASSKSNQ